MFYIIGIIVVFGSIGLGYTVHGGNLKVLYQPSEFIIIVGAAIGSVLIGYPSSSISKTLRNLKCMFRTGPYEKKDYMEQNL